MHCPSQPLVGCARPPPVSSPEGAPFVPQPLSQGRFARSANGVWKAWIWGPKVRLADFWSVPALPASPVDYLVDPPVDKSCSAPPAGDSLAASHSPFAAMRASRGGPFFAAVAPLPPLRTKKKTL